MAEFLIYNKTHWMDLPSKDFPELIGFENVRQKIMANEALTLEQSTKALIINQWKYDMRDQPGDIIEVRRDNGPRGSKEAESFAFITVPMELETAKQFVRVYVVNDEVKHKCKYWIDMVGLVLDKDKQAELTLAEFNNRLKAKK